MPKKKYLVTLTDEERTQLEHLLRGGKAVTRKVTRARILLKAADGWQDSRIAEALSIGRATVERTRQRFVEENLAAHDERPRPGNSPKLDAKAEARLIAEACSAAPDGRKRWTLCLLADRVVQLQLAESYSYEAVRRVLKKTVSSVGASAVVEGTMVHPGGQRRSCRLHGRRTGTLRRAVRRETPASQL